MIESQQIKVRGRNGWFRLGSIRVTCGEKMAWLSAVPKSKAGTAHVLFETYGTDATHRLGSMLVIMGQAMVDGKSVSVEAENVKEDQ